MEKGFRHDEVGKWSEIKLAIIREYANAYSKILSGHKGATLKHVYIDAFAGAGTHISKETGEFIDGSPIIALNVEPPFSEYHFIDMNRAKVKALSDEAGKRNNVHIYEGDCNIELKKILPRARYEDYRRALCILDPYGLHLKWDIIHQIGQMETIEIFLNFPIMDINMNVLKHDQTKVEQDQIDRMNGFWGDESWRNVAYAKPKQQSFLEFGDAPDEKVPNESVVEGFRKRLKEDAGFKYVPDPIPMRNTNNAVVYYLFFASSNQTGEKIAKSIFRKYSVDGGT